MSNVGKKILTMSLSVPSCVAPLDIERMGENFAFVSQSRFLNQSYILCNCVKQNHSWVSVEISQIVFSYTGAREVKEV